MKRNIRRHRSRGQGIVEFALILPIFLSLVFGTVDLGRLIFLQSLVNNAARDGARFGLQDEGAADISNQVQSSGRIFGSGLTICSEIIYTSTLLSGAPACSNGTTSGSQATSTYGYITVKVTYPFQPATGNFLGNWTVPLTAQSTMMFWP